MTTPRKKTPDVLGAILTPALAHLQTSKPAEQETGAPVGQYTSETVHQYTGEPAQDNVKATFYLSPAVLEALEDAWIRLRRMGKGGDRGKVSKSRLVEVALELALEDLEAAGAASALASRLVPQQTRKP